jgi:TatD DNase family protein
MSVPAPYVTDTHCHLTANAFQKDRKQVIQRALEAGVDRIIVPGMDLESSRQAVALAEEFPSVYAAVGIHPHNADSWDSTFSSTLAELAKRGGVVAIGEIGLDFYRNLSTKNNQAYAFREQLNLAAEFGLPVIIHNREATVEIMHELRHWVTDINSAHQSNAGVLHAFSADLNTALEAIQAGFYIGIAGPISFKNSGVLQNVAGSIPISRVLTETDSPFLTPHPHRNRRNEPANVVVVAEHLSRIIKRDYDTTVKVTSQNAAKLFGWENGKN